MGYQTFNETHKSEWLDEAVQKGARASDMVTSVPCIDVPIEEIIKLDGSFTLEGEPRRAIRIESNGPYGYFVYDETGWRHVAYSNPRYFLDAEDTEMGMKGNST